MTESKRPAWVKWVALGCVGLFVVVVLVLWAFVNLIMGSLKQSDAYKEALAKVQSSPAAIAALGEPIEPGFFLSGSVHVSGPSGEAELSIPVAGPQAEGTLYLEATKRAGKWEYALLELAVDGRGERIDLLAGE